MTKYGPIFSVAGYKTHLDVALNMADHNLFEPSAGGRDDAQKLLIVVTDGRHDPSVPAGNYTDHIPDTS